MRVTSVIGAGVMLAALATATACRPVQGVACPAIGYVTTVNVSLAEAWPGRADLQLDVTCTTGGVDGAPCDLRGTSSGPTWHGTAALAPAAVVATVRRGDVVLDTQTVALSSRVTDHPYGPECGGPVEAEATVPAP
jgi:hypothetical protein